MTTTVNKAYSLLTVKEFDDEARIIKGIATTPETDRAGDIVVSEGAKFKNPLPLLWQHYASKPIGKATFGKPTKDGIPFEAHLPKVTEPGVLKDRIDEAWQSVKHRLVTGVSIGFRAFEDGFEFLKGGGVQFNSFEIFELSLVTIPANASATITEIKALANPGETATRTSATINNARVRASNVSKTNKESKTMNIQEKIKEFEATRAANSSRMEALLTKSAEEDRVLNDEESTEYDELKGSIEGIDKHLSRLHDMEKINREKAAPVEGKSTTTGSGSRTGEVRIIRGQQFEKGIEFAQFAICLAAAKGNVPQALEIAKSRYSGNESLVTSLKAAVSAGTTTDTTWAAPLVDTYQRFAGDFIEFLRPQTVLGKFGTGGIPSLRRVPFNISVAGQTSGGAGYWVGEGAPKPLTKFDYNEVTLRWAKVANIAVLTEELVRFSNPAAESLVRQSLADALIARLDIDFIDPTKAEVSNVSPASIINGVTPVASSGTDADAVRRDIAAVFQKYIAANQTPTGGVWIMSASRALALSLMRNPLGQSEFPGINMMGGTLEGLPVIVSEYIPRTAGDPVGPPITPDTDIVILVNASDVFLADDGQVMIDASREASLQMLDDPTNNSGTGTATTMISMFQTNSVAIRAERWINWKKRRSTAAQYISGVAWGYVAP